MTFLACATASCSWCCCPCCSSCGRRLPGTPAEWVHLAVVGFLIQGIYFSLGYIALSTNISTALVALIGSLQPVLVAIIAPRYTGERVGTWVWIGLGLGPAGAAMVILARSAVEVISALGVLAARWRIAWASRPARSTRNDSGSTSIRSRRTRCSTRPVWL